LHPLGSEGVNARRRLAREVETMRRVRSPYVAEVLDADVAGEFPYIVTRFVSGPTLDEMVRTRGPLSGPGLRRLAHGMAEALTAIHAAGVVHRDLKPGNVMLTDDRPIVIDFGIAQTGDATRLTQTGLVMGTPGYLAPEVIEGQPSSPASDVHSWGSTMAFAATGHLPFGGGSYETIFYRIISGRADLSGVPAPLVPLISAALDGADPLPPLSDPPASGQQKQQPYRSQAGPWGPRGPSPAAAAPASAAASRPAARPNTAAGLAVMVALVALTVVLPVAGLLVSLAVITLLRAADRAQSKLAVRRSVRGPRASDLVVVLVTAPLTVARALLTEALMAPLAVIVGAAAYGLAVVVTHSADMPRAGAYAAAAVVAWYGLGPGSGRPRRQLNRMAGAMARTRTSAAAI